MKFCINDFLCYDLTTIFIFISMIVILYLFIINNENKHKYLTKKINYLQYQKNQNEMSNLFKNAVEVQNHNNPLTPPTRKYVARNPPVVVKEIAVPINVATRGRSGPYQQVGTLTKTSEDGSDPKILPLYGKPTYPGSNQWLYYTNTDTYNTIKIPIENQNKNCQKHYGCKEIYDGDNVTVPAYKGEFKANIYELDTPRYIPYL